MSTLRISNIEAKSVPASATIDEKVKITNSSGDPLVFIDGKTSGITTVGINTTDPNITFDANSNVVVTGIITATKFSGQFEPTNLTMSGDLSIADKIIHTGDTNTAIRFPANDTISFETSGNEKVRIDSEGRILSRHSASRTVGTKTGQLQVIESFNNAAISIIQTNNAASAPFLAFGKTRSANDTGSTIVQNNDSLGQILFCGADGTDVDSIGAWILAQVDGTPDSNDMPGRLIFSTSSVGSPTPTERLRINSSGQMGLGTNNPNANFHIKSTFPAIRLEDDSDYSQIDANGGSLRLLADAGNASSNSSIQFQVDGTERLRIASDGEVNLTGELSITNTAPSITLTDSANSQYAYIDGNSGNLVLHSDKGGSGSSSTLKLAVDNNVKVTVDSSGDLEIHDGDLKVASGHGIDFSATSDGSGTTSSEILDEYEEGSWTPALPSAGSATMVGRYTKIGNTVLWQLTINNISGTASFVISGLPYTVNSSWGGGISISNYGGTYPVLVFAHSGDTKIYFRNTSNSTYNINAFTGKFFYVHGFYYVN